MNSTASFDCDPRTNLESPLKLVTCALPYANNHLHLGHLLEQIQADIWVRYLKLQGENVVFICGDDTHGTPIMLQARSEGVAEEDILKKYRWSHESDAKAFAISFDHYDSTHEVHCQATVCDIYNKIKEKGYIYRQTIKQLYDASAQMFLPDRMVKGACPSCKANDQYGDACEQCGATYSAEKLINPRTVLTQSVPELRDSEHLFFDLKKFENVLKRWLSEAFLQSPLVHKSSEWLTQGLLGWDISRDSPYFGVKIPGEEKKFFYVWLDAVSGYIGASKAFWKFDSKKWEKFWSKDSADELHQFIGKDISYFHTLFWPALLQAADYRLPTRIHAHGYLTMKKEKMSKSRQTFIFAKDFKAHLPTETLRYYFACKLNSHIEDVDFCLNDLMLRFNTDLVGKVANLAARSAKFIHTYFEGQLSATLTTDHVFDNVCQRFNSVGQYFSQFEYSKAIRLLLQFADEANSFFDRHQPWSAVGDKEKLTHVHAVCTEALSIFRIIAMGLKPVIPEFSKKSLEIFEPIQGWSDVLQAPLEQNILKFSKLCERIRPEMLEPLLTH